MTPSPQSKPGWPESKPVNNASDRGMQMMFIPMGQLPPIAIAYARNMCNRMGMCMEVLLSAYTVYAHYVEGYTFDGVDELYIPPADEVAIIKQIIEEHKK